MTDNIAITAGTGTNVGTKNIGGVNYQRVQPVFGASPTDVATTAGLPVQIDQTTPGTTNRTYINTAPLITAANAAITRVANTTPYANGQFIANSATAASCTLANSGFTIVAARGTNITGRITGGLLKKSGTSNVNAVFRVHIFNSNPLASAPSNGDGGTFDMANGGNWLGYFDVNQMEAFGDSAVGICVPGLLSYVNFSPDSGTSSVYAVLEARAAYTPISAEVFTLTLDTE